MASSRTSSPALSRFKSLFVIARNSSFTYKGKARRHQAGRPRARRALCAGRQRAQGGGNRVRITGQLIEAATGTHLWADRFDGALEDVFELRIGSTSKRRRRHRAQSRAGRDRARQSASRRQPRRLRSASCGPWPLPYRHESEAWTRRSALFRRAMELDPDHALALRLRMHRCSYAPSSQRLDGRSVSEKITKARRLRVGARSRSARTMRACALHAAVLALGHACASSMTALSLRRPAIALNPNLRRAWTMRGWIIAWLRASRQTAIEHLNALMRLKSTRSGAAMRYMGMAHALTSVLGRYDEALHWATRALCEQAEFVRALRVSTLLACALAGTTSTKRDESLRAY